MRLMFVITRGDSAGGAQMHVRDLACRLAADGHDVMVVAGSTGLLTDELAAAGVATARCPGLLREIHPLHDVRAVAQLVRLIRAFDPDLVTTHSSKAGMLGRIAAKLAGKPSIFTVHGWAFIDTVRQPARGAYRRLERGTAHLADRIICVSEQLLGMGLDAGIAEHKMTVIHNGLPDVPVALRATPDVEPARAIMVARFAPPKDHATAVRAVAQVPGFRLDFVGDGPEEAAVKALADELGVGHRVRFLGARTDVAELLAQSQIFLLSSRSEGFPISTLEAMRAGLPVVVANVGGAPEAVRRGESGFVFERENSDELAGVLRRLHEDPALRLRMGAAGRRFYKSAFAFERMYERTLDVYAAVGIPASRTDVGAAPRPVLGHLGAPARSGRPID